MPCPCTRVLRLDTFRRDRLLGAARDLAGAQQLYAQHPSLDAVFCQNDPGQRVIWRTHLVCACEPGWTRVGASVGVIYGVPGKALVEAYQALPDPLVVCLVHESTDPEKPTNLDHRALKRLQKLADEDPRKELLVVPFGPPVLVHTHQLTAPRLRLETLIAP